MASGTRAILIQKARYWAEEIARYDDESKDLVDTLVRIANFLEDEEEA